MLVMILPVVANAQTGRFTLQGQLGSSRAEKIYLYTADIITGTSRTDSSLIGPKGSFSFRGELSVPLKAILFSVPDHNRLDLYLEPGKMNVESPDSLPSALVNAGMLNDHFVKLRKMIDAIDHERRVFVKKISVEIKAKPDNMSLSIERDRQMKIFAARTDSTYLAFASGNPANLAAVYAIANVGGANPQLSQVRPLFENLDESVRKSPVGLAYGRKLHQLALVDVGAPAPDFTQADTSGRKVSLRDFRGKFVLIDFWASWCGPCRQENPNLVKAFNKYQSRNFTVIGVSLDKENARTAWLKAIAKDGLPWTQVSDLKGWNNEVSRMYSVESVPKNFLVDPSGKIVAKDLRGEKLNTRLAELLGAGN